MIKSVSCRVLIMSALFMIMIQEISGGKWSSNHIIVLREVKSAFTDILRKSMWMDSSTRKKAEEKADKITNMVGFPDYIMNNTRLTDKYKDLAVATSDYFK